MSDYTYDVETFPNVFTLSAECIDTGLTWQFEISEFRSDLAELIEFMRYLMSSKARLVGFNNLGFDYPLLHRILITKCDDPQDIYDHAMTIINTEFGVNRWAHQINQSQHIVPQLDLFKIHHFDNPARSTSLKMLEFNMRSKRIKELPFAVGSMLHQHQIVTLLDYNMHDVKETTAFYKHTREMISFREELTKMYKRDFMNHNDTKIGKDYFVMRLEESGVQCYDKTPSGRKPRQTLRPEIVLKDAILPSISFDQPELTRVLGWLREQTITETEGVFKGLTATVEGFTFIFGLGGIHGSVDSRIIEANEHYDLIDLDVASYYPNLAIQNGFFPGHLGKKFCDIYRDLYEQRRLFAKGSAENAMLKLGLNGVYGDSNNAYSPLFDPLFTMSTTLNGQLLLCKLAESLLTVDGLQLIQANTDGLTILVPKGGVEAAREVWGKWETTTSLTLERSDYSRMFIRDVNNYIAEYTSGKLKRKGVYEYKLGWEKDHSALIIPKVAEKVLIEGVPIAETVKNWPDVMDFMLRTKVPKSSYLTIGDEKTQNISRYYVANEGGHLFKHMPPLKSKTEWRKIAVQSGWRVVVCNDIPDHIDRGTINFEYYIQEVEKICLGLA